MKSFRLWALTASVLFALVGAAGAGAQGASVVMSGLDNPRGLAFGPEGALYVTTRTNQAGVGGVVRIVP